jgi:hypothetical protein
VAVRLRRMRLMSHSETSVDALSLSGGGGSETAVETVGFEGASLVGV